MIPGKKRLLVESPIGEVKIDTAGATIGIVKMEATKAYSGIPANTKYVFDTDSTS